MSSIFGKSQAHALYHKYINCHISKSIIILVTNFIELFHSTIRKKNNNYIDYFAFSEGYLRQVTLFQ